MLKKKEKFSSVFEAASKLEREKKGDFSVPEQNTVTSLSAGLDFPSVPEVPKNLPPIEKEEDVLEQFKRCQQMHYELQGRVESFCSKLGISLLEFRKRLDDPSQFTSSEWQKMRSMVARMKDQIAQLVPEKEQPTEEEEKETEGQGEKEKRTKKKPGMLSKRRWLSMQ